MKTAEKLITNNLYLDTHIVNFATRIQNDLSTEIDDIFVDIVRFRSSSIVNGLSNHNTQYLMINNLLQ
jgi:hypothetical protein